MTDEQKRYILSKSQKIITFAFEKNVNVSDEDWEYIVDQVKMVHEATKENRICGEILAETAQYINKLQKLMEKSL